MNKAHMNNLRNGLMMIHKELHTFIVNIVTRMRMPFGKTVSFTSKTKRNLTLYTICISQCVFLASIANRYSGILYFF